MDYTSIEQRGTDIALTDIKNFIPSQVLDCGQCFRWSGSGGTYTGIAHGRRLEISLEAPVEGDELILKNTTKEEFSNIWQDYFDLGRDYGQLRQDYADDKTMKKALEFSPGLRIMKQDTWETLITFILSQNSNIPRIKGMVASLCENFGRAIQYSDIGKDYAFPAPQDLAVLSAGDLVSVKSGYRAPYIIAAAKWAAEGHLQELENQSTEDIRKALMEVHGVGPKVADCVLLYGFGRVECYPLDVWMKRVMAKYYPKGFPKSLADTAGIAQQFLFHYARMQGVK